MDNENPEEQIEMRNPFPSPPSFYTNYTTHNLKLLALLRQRSGVQDPLALASINQQEILSDQEDVPIWPLTTLEKPRVDWINEENEYTVFGRTYPVRQSSLWL
jgi:mediator of RNA polymerase II transcription subunit 7